MPAKASEIERVDRKFGFKKVRQKGSHARWQQLDGRASTVPIHGKAEIGSWLFQETLKQLGVTDQEFIRLPCTKRVRGRSFSALLTEADEHYSAISIFCSQISLPYGR
ncbi:putative periplasmic or secreted lipoprotein [Rubidibacter lacunae KORDI 51-2]|uniref:Putative periplasmic or secreted lipoprotein n=1 Tax=Rubidibacter lacunae KORDI 51-2 TaxID=582515 RepID=U5DID4_9CHRO|nr:type II toxin-antitoxin system HicA family toxin [Rubidibacter lacunae]ERN41431.1 putative periplasmic or secreted lipoprotein [Rubidibacter lacunae KORDI 51-2]